MRAGRGDEARRAATGDRVIEYVGHPHEHFLDPVVIERGADRAPARPVFSAQMRPGSPARYAYPEGAQWQ